MKTTQVALIFLLLWFEDTKSLTQKRVNLGENVTLDCAIDIREVYWVFQELSDSPAVILRTFTSTAPSAHILEERFRGKYSALNQSNLFIRNITDNELGIYYCAKPGNTFNISKGFQLYTSESAQDNNQTNAQGSKLEKQVELYKNLTVASFLLNVVLIILITGLLMFRRKKPKSRQHRHNIEPDPPQDLYAAQYSEIELPEYPRRESALQTNGTYDLLQKPNPHPK